MSTSVFPSLPGQGWPVKRTPQFKSQIIQATSGKETRIALQSAPRYLYELSFETIRQNATTFEYQQLVAFYNNCLGSFDSFLYNDPDDHAVTGQVLGLGNNSNKAFQMFRAFGAAGFNKWSDVILAPNIVTAVYLGGVLQSSSAYTVSFWGASLPGVITFTTPPSNNVQVSADFSWYWPSRFTDDTMEFTKNYQGLFSIDSLKFLTLV